MSCLWKTSPASRDRLGPRCPKWQVDLGSASSLSRWDPATVDILGQAGDDTYLSYFQQ